MLRWSEVSDISKHGDVTLGYYWPSDKSEIGLSASWPQLTIGNWKQWKQNDGGVSYYNPGYPLNFEVNFFWSLIIPIRQAGVELTILSSLFSCFYKILFHFPEGTVVSPLSSPSFLENLFSLHLLIITFQHLPRIWRKTLCV